jgi:hypothetical protein
MRVNIADEHHVQIKYAYPVAYNFIDDCICEGPVTKLRRSSSLHVERKNSANSPYVDHLTEV